jgi:RNA polymerase sigma-70 factor, ECF subfamily
VEKEAAMFTRVSEIYEPQGQTVFANAPGAEDTALVTAAKSGDAQAFETLVRRYERRMLAVGMRFTGVREDAEDIVQESFQKAFVHLCKFEGKSSFSTWLTRIAINEGLMLLRRYRGLREISIDDSSDDEEISFELDIPDSAPGPESSYLQREQKRIVSSAVKRLNATTRKAMELRELGELSTVETARALGLSIAAVKARVFHGRRKLRKRLRLYFESTLRCGSPIPGRNPNRNRVSLTPSAAGVTRQKSTGALHGDLGKKRVGLPIDGIASSGVIEFAIGV